MLIYNYSEDQIQDMWVTIERVEREYWYLRYMRVYINIPYNINIITPIDNDY